MLEFLTRYTTNIYYQIIRQLTDKIAVPFTHFGKEINNQHFSEQKRVHQISPDKKNYRVSLSAPRASDKYLLLRMDTETSSENSGLVHRKSPPMLPNKPGLPILAHRLGFIRDVQKSLNIRVEAGLAQ